MARRRRKALTILASLVIAGGLLKLVLDDDPVEVAMPEPRPPSHVARTELTAALAATLAQRPGGR